MIVPHRAGLLIRVKRRERAASERAIDSRQARGMRRILICNLTGMMHSACIKDVSAKRKGKRVDDAVVAMQAKAVHKAVLEDMQDGSLKEIHGWVQPL